MKSGRGAAAYRAAASEGIAAPLPGRAAGRKIDVAAVAAVRNVIWLLVLILVTFLVHRDIFAYSFIGSDTLTLIETARIQSLGDLLRVFTTPPMNGTAFMEISAFYRPVAVLSYSLDWALWGLAPFGYHLTDLLLHATVLILIYFLVLRLGRSRALAGLSALIFTLHPLLIENLSASSRRQSILPALFMLLAFILFIKRHDGANGRKWLGVASLCAYLLALGSQEIACIFPALTLPYVLIYDDSAFASRIRAALKTTAPYLLATLAFLAWRAIVLQGLGGYRQNNLPGSAAAVFAQINFSYFSDLFYPADLISWWLGSRAALVRSALLYGCLVIAGLLLSLYGWRLANSLAARSRREALALKSLLLGLFVASMVLLLGTSSLADGFIGPGLKQSLYVALSMPMIIAAAALVAIDQRSRLQRCLRCSPRGRLAVWAAIWTLLPLLVYLPTLTFSHRSMYLPLIPFAIMVALALRHGSQGLRALLTAEGRSTARWAGAVPSAVFVLALALALSFPISTLLIKKSGEWGAVSALTELLLARVSQATASLPADGELELYDLPKGIEYFSGELPHAKEISYPMGYSIQSWLTLTAPERRIEVIMHDRIVLAECPAAIDAAVESGIAGRQQLRLLYTGGSCAAAR